jgi:hypothetical protein
MGIKDSMLASAFPAGKQKGPKVKKIKSTRDTGEKSVVDQNQQHGEESNSEESKRISTNKPKQMSHSSKAMLSPDYDAPRAAIMNNGPGKSKEPAAESPHDRVMRHAHKAKVEATKRWIDGELTPEKHDAIHARANKVIKHARMRP